MIGFDWDEANIEHIARHDVIPSECEEVFANDPIEDEDSFIVNEELRFTVYGITHKARLLSVVYTWRRELIRTVTARDMSRKERKIYAKQFER